MNINLDKKILLMFLGGTPNSANIIKHWVSMNKEFTKSANYYLVIHPIILTNFVIDTNFKQIFNPENIYIVNEEHHMLTEWATRSISDSTLIMMEYAHLANNHELFDKYILLSSNCCPLYNLDEIYNQITSNDKSWLATNDSIFLSDDYVGQMDIMDIMDIIMYMSQKIYMVNVLTIMNTLIIYFYLKGTP